MAPYITIADVRAAGVLDPPDDTAITAAITRWQQFIERATRNFFDSRTFILELDGNDSDTLFLPVPIITLNNLFVNDSFTVAVDPTRIRVYNNRGPIQDDRYNPKIRLFETLSLFLPPPRSTFGPVFLKGRQNQRVDAAFGFTEPDGSTPELIKRALLKLVVKQLTEEDALGGLGVTITTPAFAGPVISETTDGHSLSFGFEPGRKTKAGFNQITGDSEVDQILAMYRAPISMGVPGSTLWFMG